MTYDFRLKDFQSKQDEISIKNMASRKCQSQRKDG